MVFKIEGEDLVVLDCKVVSGLGEAKAWFKRVREAKPWETRQ